MEGIKNTVIRDEFVEDVASHRLEVCQACHHRDDEGSECVVPGTKPCCSLCGCSLSLKTRALSTECPDGRWFSIITDEDAEKLENLED
jgi:hypothetical protein